MIDIQVAAVEEIPAVLACIPVTLENIQPCEFNLFFREAVKKGQNDDPWNPDSQGDGLEHPGFGIGEGKIPPTQKIMGQEISVSVGCDSLSLPLIKKGQGPSGRAGVDSLPQPVEYKHRLVEQCIHDIVDR